MKKYLLFATQLYCYPIFRPIQDAARRRGAEVAWFIHEIPDRLESDETRLHTVEDVKQFDPEAVFSATNWTPDFFPGVKVQVFHGFDVGKRANTRQSHFRIRDMYDLYCTQGPNTTHPFEALARTHKNFAVAETGWCKLDTLFTYPTPELIISKLKTNKPVILYATTFTPNMTSAPILVKKIQQMSNTGNWHWLITLHPKSDPKVVQQYRELASDNLSFYEPGCDIVPLLHAADAMLCDTSSIFLEFLLLNKPVVTYKTAVPGNHLLDVDSIDAIEPALATALTRPESLMDNITSYTRELHPSRDGKASERILDATDDFIRNGQHSLDAKPLNLFRKLKMRKWLHYYHWR